MSREDETAATPDPLTASLREAGLHDAVVAKITAVIARRIVSVGAINHLAHEIAEEHRVPSVVSWLMQFFVLHDVTILSDESMREVEMALSVPKPLPYAPASPVALPSQSTVEKDDDRIRFFWGSDLGGRRQWYWRVAPDRWYDDSMIAVSNALAGDLERAYQHLNVRRYRK